MADQLIQGVTNDVYLRGYNVRRTGAAITDATATATIYDANDRAVSGATGLSVSYDSTNHEYYVAIPASAGLIAGSRYRVRVNVLNYDDIFEVRANCVSPGASR